ncbi:uncharacterized protein LOC123024324 [Varanus komodoensis]|uniref:uncharacterized protein LOC123024324 n=1 Tax=Varanus komodoensis TaxID=61221 RepID=UPI001CF7AEBF|nr:uncharacterized protein LOC123024324 [Varanus komodoensis]
MDPLATSSVSSRLWVLQFFRNLFGSRQQVTQEGQSPQADAEEKDDVRSELLGCPLPDSDMMLLGKEMSTANTSSHDIFEGVTESHSEELSLLKEMRLEDTTIPGDEKKLSALLKSTGMGMGDSDGSADSIISNSEQHPREKNHATGKKNKESGDRGKDGISQVLSTDDEVSMTTGPMAEIKDTSTEEEKEHLLKEDVRLEPPKAELSPWNRLISMYKQRRRLPASKVSHLQDIPAQPVIEDEATLDLMIYGIAAPKAHITLSNSPGTVSACDRLPDNKVREVDGDCETEHRDSGPNDDESLEHPENAY